MSRAEQIRRDTDNVKLPESHLIDIDSVVKFHLENHVLMSITNSKNNPLEIPVIYANPEIWASVQSTGVLRDTKTNKIKVPVLAFRRGTVTKDREKIKNLDANKSNLYGTVQKQYTDVNRYDKFSVLNNIVPKKELYHVVVPDFVIVDYNCKIWSDYITHMNKIVEAINYTDSSYWSDDKFKYYVVVSEFGDIEDVNVDDGRSVMCEFNLSIRAQLRPTNIQKDLNSIKKTFSVNSLNVTFKEQ